MWTEWFTTTKDKCVTFWNQSLEIIFNQSALSKIAYENNAKKHFYFGNGLHSLAIPYFQKNVIKKDPKPKSSGCFQSHWSCASLIQCYSIIIHSIILTNEIIHLNTLSKALPCIFLRCPDASVKYLLHSVLKNFLCSGEDRHWQHVLSITTLAGCENWKKYLSSNQQSTLDSGIYFYFSIKIGTLGHDLEFQN